MRKNWDYGFLALLLALGGTACKPTSKGESEIGSHAAEISDLDAPTKNSILAPHITGTVETMVIDRSESSPSDFRSALVTEDGKRFPILVSHDDLPILSGSKVSLSREKLSADEPLANHDVQSFITKLPVQSPLSAFNEHRIAVVKVFFGDRALDSPPPLSNDEILTTFNGPQRRNVNDYYLEASGGRMGIRVTAADIFGWYRMAEVDPNCDTTNLFTLLPKVLARADAEIDFNRYTDLMIVAPFAKEGVGCMVVGQAILGNTMVNTQEGSKPIGATLLRYEAMGLTYGGPTYAIHEIGHTLGLYHAHSIENGATVEYGDIYSAMGMPYGRASAIRAPHFNAFEKERLGWFSEGNEILNVEKSGEYRLEPFSANTRVNGGEGPRPSPEDGELPRFKALKVGNLYVEYRQPIGYDSMLAGWGTEDVFNGPLIHVRSSDNASIVHAHSNEPSENFALHDQFFYEGNFIRKISQTSSELRLQVIPADEFMTLTAQAIGTDSVATSVTYSIHFVDFSAIANTAVSLKSLDSSRTVYTQIYTSPNGDFGKTIDLSSVPEMNTFQLSVTTTYVAGGKYEKLWSFDRHYPDPIPPVVELMEPKDGSMWSWGIPFKAQASDSTGIKKITFHSRLLDPVTGAPVAEWSTDLSPLLQSPDSKLYLEANGVYQFVARAEDFGGNISESQVSRVTVDIEKPKISFPSIVPGVSLGGQQWLEVVAEDPLRNGVRSGIRTLRVYILLSCYSRLGCPNNKILVGKAEGSESAIEIDTRTIQSGPAVFWGEAEDMAGNLGRTAVPVQIYNLSSPPPGPYHFPE